LRKAVRQSPRVSDPDDPRKPRGRGVLKRSPSRKYRYLRQWEFRKCRLSSFHRDIRLFSRCPPDRILSHTHGATASCPISIIRTCASTHKESSVECCPIDTNISVLPSLSAPKFFSQGDHAVAQRWPDRPARCAPETFVVIQVALIFLIELCTI
jgi:hypothetical protein